MSEMTTSKLFVVAFLAVLLANLATLAVVRMWMEHEARRTTLRLGKPMSGRGPNPPSPSYNLSSDSTNAHGLPKFTYTSACKIADRKEKGL